MLLKILCESDLAASMGVTRLAGLTFLSGGELRSMMEFDGRLIVRIGIILSPAFAFFETGLSVVGASSSPRKQTPQFIKTFMTNVKQFSEAFFKRSLQQCVQVNLPDNAA